MDLGGRLRGEAGGLAGVHEPAVVDDQQPVADLLELAQHVRGHQDGAVLGREAAEQVAHLAHADRVEAVGRFVEHEQRRIAEQGGGDAEPLLHAERVLAEAVAGPIGEPDEVEHLGDAPHVVPAETGEDTEVLDGGERGPQRRAFDERADLAEVALGSVERLAEHGAAAAGRPDEAEQHRHGRGLAGAVGTDEAGHDAARQLDGQRVDRDPLAVVLGQALDGEDWCGCHDDQRAGLAVSRRQARDDTSAYVAGRTRPDW